MTRESGEMSSEALGFETLQHQLVGSMKLVEMTCALAAQHDLDRILETVTTGVCEALGCERASLYLYDEQSQELFTRVVTALEIEEIRTSIESGITGWVARRRKVANIPDPHVDARWNSSIDRKTGYTTRNILAAPLVSSHDDRLVGVLQLLNKEEGAFDSFDEQLIQAFASHAATAVERAQLMKDARRSHELELSVEMGRAIQTGFLPQEIPEVPGYELAAWWKPAEAVSGDYYDVVPLADGRLGLVIADVSGHGVAASLLMASVRAMIRVLARTVPEPDRILSLLSETIAPDLELGRFITILMIALDAKSHEFDYANAGHGPALHYHREAATFQPLGSTTLPLGFAGDQQIPAGRPSRLEPGDLLVLATDGAVELLNDEHEMFGRERLQRVIAACPTLSATGALSRIREAIERFHSAEEPPDDITVLIVERRLHPPQPE